MTEDGEPESAEVVCAALFAISAGGVADVPGLADPEVVCITGTRPARSGYEGHEGTGMALLGADPRGVYPVPAAPPVTRQHAHVTTCLAPGGSLDDTIAATMLPEGIPNDVRMRRVWHQ